MKPLTVNIRHKKKKWTQYELERLHDRKIDLIDRFSRVYKLPKLLLIFWEVLYKSGVCIVDQIQLLREKTGEKWNHYRYMKTRKILYKELKDD